MNDPHDRDIVFRYDAVGRLREIEDFTGRKIEGGEDIPGRKITYEYDAEVHLVKVLSP